MTTPNTGEVTIAVSSCLLGENVRYDGGNKFSNIVTSELGRYFRLLGVCPEMAIGMGVPRKPVQVVQLNRELRVRGVEDARMDVTDQLYAYASNFTKQHTNICGYVFKQRSPSCGLGETPLFNEQGEEVGQTDGLFAGLIKKMMPDLPLIDEQQIENAQARDAFINAVLARYHKRQPPVK
jgi:uncharacterized protein YbbK (DUF523 family)